MRRWAAPAVLLVALVFCAPAAALPLVAIDPGHGGADSGAVGVLPPGTPTGLAPRAGTAGQTLLLEKDVTLDIGRRLDAWLRARGFPTVMTRTLDLAGGDRPYTSEGADLRARVEIANTRGADMFVSIHENSLGATSTGTETYHFYYASTAARSLAVSIHQEVVLRLGLPDRGVKSAGFFVLRNTAMPAVLVEGAFLSNPAEAAYLARPEIRQRLAEGIGAGIVRYSQGVRIPPTSYGPSPRPAPLVIRYWVTAGVFRTRLAASRRVALLHRKRVKGIIRVRYSTTFKRRLYYVVTGQYIFLQNARNDRNRLIRLRVPARVNSAPR